MKIGTIIREKRKELSLTQEQLADLLGVSAPAQSLYKRITEDLEHSEEFAFFRGSPEYEQLRPLLKETSDVGKQISYELSI